MSKRSDKRQVPSGLSRSRMWGDPKDYRYMVTLMSDTDSVNKSNFLKEVNVHMCTVKFDVFLSVLTLSRSMQIKCNQS